MRLTSMLSPLTAPLFGTLALVAAVPAANAADLGSAASFNSGYGRSSGEENRLTLANRRDANGNRVIVNGVMSGAGVSTQDGVQQATAGGGSGVRGSGSATAIGNSLNVSVTGSWNTVIVDSQQVNNGDQTAGVSLNGDLKL